MTAKKSRKFPPGEHNYLVQEIIAVACEKTGLKRKPLMLALVPYGVNYNTTHAVFYCVVRGSQEFTDQLVRAVALLQDSYIAATPDNGRLVKLQAKEKAANDQLRKIRRAVERMCVACAAPDSGETPRCWDGTCPLRSVSPLPLAKGE